MIFADKKLQKKVEELEQEIKELETDLVHDSLTGLKTRAFFEEEMRVYLEVISQNEQGKRKEWFGFKNISIIFLDIDHFKSINDTYGHDTGDQVLKKVAEAIRKSLRTGDTPTRWGGEEMVVSLLGASETDAVQKAKEIREAISKLEFPEASELKVTASAGVASSEKGENLLALVKRADAALYKAKDSGRNKVVAYSTL